MIFDNMEAFEGLSAFWPSGLSGSILVTTRNKTLAKEFTEFQLSVSPFEPLEARRFLLKYRTNDTELTSEEDNAATIISQRLGNLPLVLDLVRHHVSASGSSYKEFLQSYGEPIEPFLYDRSSASWKNEWYHQNILATYTLRLQKMSKKAAEMVEVLAILDASCVPLSIFRADNEAMSDQSTFRIWPLMLTVDTGCIMARILKMSCPNSKIGLKAQSRILTSEHDARPIMPQTSANNGPDLTQWCQN